MKKLFLSMLLILIGLCSVAQCNTATSKTYIIQGQGRPQDIYQITPNPMWKGGDTLEILAGNYNDVIEFDHLHGDSCRPITIINSGGLVYATTIRLKADCEYVHLTGTGAPGLQYGFKTIGGPLSGDYGKYIEMDHIEVDSALAGYGVVFKTVQDTSHPNTIYKQGQVNYLSTNIHIHDNWIHYTGNEGMYIGPTDPMGGNVVITINGVDTYPLPLRLDSVEIDHNLIQNTGWDGIQLSNSRDGCSIHDNTVYNFGMSNASSQQAGIITGGNTNSKVYNNKVTRGTGNGIQAFGYGLIKISNNVVDSVGVDKTALGQASFFSNDYINTVEIDPKMQLYIVGNSFSAIQPVGAIQIDNENNNSLPSIIDSNTFCIPNAPSDWQTLYITSPVFGSTNISNALDTRCEEILPIPTPPKPTPVIVKPKQFTQHIGYLTVVSTIVCPWSLSTSNGALLQIGMMHVGTNYIYLTRYPRGVYIFEYDNSYQKVINIK